MTSGLGLRGGLRRLSRGLIAYGLIGLVLAAAGLGALVWVDGRIGQLRGEVATTLAQRAATMTLAGRVLHDASTTAQGVTVTLDQTSLAVSSAAGTVTETRSDLADLEAQLRSVSLLGQTPLSSSADAVDGINASLEGLDTRLSLVADSLNGNRQAVLASATSLDQLADGVDSLAARLGSGAIDDSLGDLERLISVTLLVLAAWSVVPALGALALGIWLRRELARSRSA